MSNFEVCEEMQKLRNYLDEHKIKWRDESEKGASVRKDNVDFDSYWMCRTRFEIKGNKFAVINGIGSYGGCFYVGTKNHGLLECWINKNKPEGYLKSDDVIKKIEEYEKKYEKNMRRNNILNMTVTEQIAKIKKDVCYYACKYREFYKDKCREDDVLFLASMQGYCHECPLNKLHYGAEISD